MIPLFIAADQWKFGVNDPSFIAWLIFATYFVAAFVCWRARIAGHTKGWLAVNNLWSVLAVLLVLLGLNKQLDLHQLALQIFGEGGVERLGSNLVRGFLIAAAGVLGTAMIGACILLFRKANRQLRWALGIFLSLLAAQVLRFLPGPISVLLVTHVFTEQEGLLHIHIIELLELSSLIAIVFLARANTGVA